MAGTHSKRPLAWKDVPWIGPLSPIKFHNEKTATSLVRVRRAVPSALRAAWSLYVLTPRVWFSRRIATIVLSAIETQGLRCLSDNRECHFFATADQHFYAKDRNGPTIMMFFD